MELKELSLPTVAEELRQQFFWCSFLSSKTYVLTPLTSWYAKVQLLKLCLEQSLKWGFPTWFIAAAQAAVEE